MHHPRSLPEIRTDRLILRQWIESDKEPFARLNSDPRVMEFFPNVLTRNESDAMVERIQNHFLQHGFGLWAIEVIGGAPFIGFTGLAVPQFGAHFTPCVEIGWRLAFEHWGKGFATEAAKAVLKSGLNDLHLSEVVSFTTLENLKSRAVMEKTGMQHDPKDDFEHPKLPVGHPLRQHVLYRTK